MYTYIDINTIQKKVPGEYFKFVLELKSNDMTQYEFADIRNGKWPKRLTKKQNESYTRVVQKYNRVCSRFRKKSGLSIELYNIIPPDSHNSWTTPNVVYKKMGSGIVVQTEESIWRTPIQLSNNLKKLNAILVYRDFK